MTTGYESYPYYYSGMARVGSSAGNSLRQNWVAPNKTQSGVSDALDAAKAPLYSIADQIQNSWSGGGGYGGGYGGGGYATPDYDDLWNKAVAADKQNVKAQRWAVDDNIQRLNLANQAIGKIADAQERAVRLNANGDFFAQDLKLQQARQSLANAMGKLPWSSSSDVGLNDLTAMQRDLNNNEIYNNKRSALTEIFNNRFNALETNRINGLKAIAEALQGIRQGYTNMVNTVGGQYEKSDPFYTGEGENTKIKYDKDSELGYYVDTIRHYKNMRDQLNANAPTLETVGLFRPDGKNRANSNPLVNRMQNTNTFNNAGTVSPGTNKNNTSRAITNMNNFNKAMSTGYDYRDENPKMTQIETGR